MDLMTSQLRRTTEPLEALFPPQHAKHGSSGFNGGAGRHGNLMTVHMNKGQASSEGRSSISERETSVSGFCCPQTADTSQPGLVLHEGLWF